MEQNLFFIKTVPQPICNKPTAKRQSKMENPCWVDWIEEDYLQFSVFGSSDSDSWSLMNFISIMLFTNWWSGIFTSISHRIVSTSQLALYFLTFWSLDYKLWQRYGIWFWLLLIFCYSFSFYNSGVRACLLFVFFIDVSSPFVFWGIKASRESATLMGLLAMRSPWTTQPNNSSATFLGCADFPVTS